MADQQQTRDEDEAIVDAWTTEFRRACQRAASAPEDPQLITALQFLIGAPASAAHAARERLSGLAEGPGPRLRVVPEITKESTR